VKRVVVKNTLSGTMSLKKCPQGMDGVIEEDDSGFVIMAD